MANASWYVHMILCLRIHQWWKLTVSTFEQCYKHTNEHLCTHFCMDMCCHSPGRSPRGGNTGSYGDSIFNILRSCFPKWLHHFTVSPATYEGANSSTSSPTLLLHDISLCGSEVYSIVVLICISLMAPSTFHVWWSIFMMAASKSLSENSTMCHPSEVRRPASIVSFHLVWDLPVHVMPNASFLKPGHFTYFVLMLWEADSYFTLWQQSGRGNGGGREDLLLTDRWERCPSSWCVLQWAMEGLCDLIVTRGSWSPSSQLRRDRLLSLSDWSGSPGFLF
jgi:hypothetical protein